MARSQVAGFAIGEPATGIAKSPQVAFEGHLDRVVVAAKSSA